MAEPLTRGEAEMDGPLAQAAARLDRALRQLEATLSVSDRPASLVVELDAARRRQRRLTEAASGASAALGQAMAEVRRTLDEDAERQGLFDFAATDGLEAEPEPAEDGKADEPSSVEEPAA